MPPTQSIEDARPLVADLVRRFEKNEIEYIRSGSPYNETELRSDFLNPFLQALGWDVYNESGQPQELREVVHEATVEVGEERLSKKPDYELRLARQRKFFIEAKKPSVNILTDKNPAFQIRRYGFSAGLPVSIVTNFRHFIVYDCSPVPDQNDEPIIARLAVYSFEELESKFDEIHSLFSRQTVYSGAFDEAYHIDATRHGTEQFDSYFLNQVSGWRELLAQDIASSNPDLPSEELTHIVQRLINRIVFLRICEDREIEKYETLKDLGAANVFSHFKDHLKYADKRYNSGLFNLLDDPSLDLNISDDVLGRIFADLYYPKSPYTFAVVEPTVLGEIYETFISQEIRNNSGKIEIVEKQEVTASGGVAATPRYVVDQIISRTLIPKIKRLTPDQLDSFRIADIACGSGVFLIQAFQFMMDHCLSWYMTDGVNKHRRRIYEVGENQYRLFLHEKRRILINCLYGVDIDSQAVEVARFGLLLKLIEDESSSSITAYLKIHKEKALPYLDGNIVCGNSLVDMTSFESFHPEEDEGLKFRINPLTWGDEFPHIFKDGGFNVIIGNPPYVRIQNMVEYSPVEARFYQSEHSGFVCSQADNFDKYSLFIERALSILKSDGLVGYIVIHKFFSTAWGQSLRTILSEGEHLINIVHFGVQQVFPKRATYTCILVLSKSRSDSFEVEHVPDLRKWRYGAPGLITHYPSKDVGSSFWSFTPKAARELFADIKSRHPATLSDVARIFVGVQTSADNIFIRSPIAEDDASITFEDVNGKNWEIEKAIVRPCLKDVRLFAFSKPEPNSYIIFPYEVRKDPDSGKDCAYIIEPDVMASCYPKTFTYLNAHRDALSGRSMTAGEFYQYGRSQALTKFTGEEKLIVKVLSLDADYAYDDFNTITTAGGNGPYYLIRPKPEYELSIFYLQAVLCHPIVEAMVRSIASVFRGGYYSHGKQFIKDLPIPTVDFSDKDQKTAHDRLVSRVKALIKAKGELAAARIPKRISYYRRRRDFLTREIIALVGDMLGVSEADYQTAELVRVG